jgi:hypothetical protein
LPVRIFDPSCDEFFVGEVVGVFQILQSGHESGGQSGCAVVFAVEGCVGFVEASPLDCIGEVAERMIQIDLGVESGLKELDLALAWIVYGRIFRLHRWSEFAMDGAENVVFSKKHCKL